MEKGTLIMNKYEKGDDVLRDDTDHKTFGISVKQENEDNYWTNKIEVYSDEKLRDDILLFLETREKLRKLLKEKFEFFQKIK